MSDPKSASVKIRPCVQSAEKFQHGHQGECQEEVKKPQRGGREELRFLRREEVHTAVTSALYDATEQRQEVMRSYTEVKQQERRR